MQAVTLPARAGLFWIDAGWRLFSATAARFVQLGNVCHVIAHFLGP